MIGNVIPNIPIGVPDDFPQPNGHPFQFEFLGDSGLSQPNVFPVAFLKRLRALLGRLKQVVGLVAGAIGGVAAHIGKVVILGDLVKSSGFQGFPQVVSKGFRWDQVEQPLIFGPTKAQDNPLAGEKIDIIRRISGFLGVFHGLTGVHRFP